MYPTEYVRYLVHFHTDRDYFECHEILEEYWKSLPDAGKDSVWVGLIQIAVGLYHQRRENFPGAEKMMASALQILSNERKKLAELGLDADELLTLVTKRLEAIRNREPYTSPQLPIGDPELLARCLACCSEQGLVFGSESNANDRYLWHKHMLRDRSDVIARREEELNRKTSQRSYPPAP